MLWVSLFCHDELRIASESLPVLAELMMSCVVLFSDRKWKKLTMQSESHAIELALKMDTKHFQKKWQLVPFTKWLNWVKLHKKAKAGLEMSFNENSNTHWTGEISDGLSLLPNWLSLKIFQYLELQDLLNCAEVCCAWKTIIQSNTLWSQINFSVGKDWITDSKMKDILQNYHIFVTHLNFRGCKSLEWHSLNWISECRNLQELNVSECLNVTDLMIQRIVENCPSLLYLNLSCTNVTNETLKQLSRNGLTLQYLSLAYCYRLTDEGFIYLKTGKGCSNLFHLNLTGCTQMTVNGFRYISAGCSSLKEIVIDDMPTLSDSCVLALLARCRCLLTISLLDAPHLSDVALKAIAEAARLKSFSTEGNNQFTDSGWKALCSSSQDLHRLHVAQCPRMTDASLKSMSTLKHLQYVDVSLSRVSDDGIQFLTEGASAKTLQELNFSQCRYITDISVMMIAQRLCKLHHLNLSYCEKLTDLAMEQLSGSSICSLDISGCNIWDEGLTNLKGVHLKKLVLAECIHVTDVGVEKLCKNMSDLEHVDVSHCAALSDAAVRSFSFHCRGLVTLRISYCPKMTDMAVQYLTCGSPYLRELDVSGCLLLTDRTIGHLKRLCPPLKSITMVCCRGISRAAARKLEPHVAYWEHSNDGPRTGLESL